MRLFLTGGSGFIGTNLVAAWAPRYAAICNFSRDPPLDSRQMAQWVQGDIMNSESLAAALLEFQPDHVIHLAARTDCDENTTVEDGYAVNTAGTRNLITAVSGCPSVRRLIVISTQFVCRAGYLPKHDRDFAPETVYGESKALSEDITRELDPNCIWTIVRPTNIWGPWHERYSREFWRVCARGWYVHPAVQSPVRSYGYVGNVVWQLQGILESLESDVHRKVFYLGDLPIRIDRWIEGFHEALSGHRRMRRVPLSVIRLAALMGDGISWLTKKRFYITSSRLSSMTTDYLTPMEPTFNLLGEPPFSLEKGIGLTADWYREHVE